MDSETGRWGLPLLAAGQAQKELTHNEALAVLDLLVEATVQAVAVDQPPATPEVGHCWIVGDQPVGDWVGRARTLAGWTTGGWRFVEPREGQRAWSVADGCAAIFGGGAWRVGRVAGTELVIGGVRVVGPRQAAIAAPSAGTVVDAEARAAIEHILTTLVAHGLIVG